jgi:hypothetical protein
MIPASKFAEQLLATALTVLLFAVVGAASFAPRSSSLGIAATEKADQADPRDINTSTAEQLKTLHLTRAGELGVRLLTEQRERSHMGVKRTGMRGTD